MDHENAWRSPVKARGAVIAVAMTTTGHAGWRKRRRDTFQIVHNNALAQAVAESSSILSTDIIMLHWQAVPNRLTIQMRESMARPQYPK